MRVDAVDTASTIHYEGGTQDSDVTPDAEPVTKKAKQGGSYVFVRTTIKNDGNAGIDITCGWPIDAKLKDQDDREYTPVKGQYLLNGNPGCNDMLDPGFKDRMTWAFLIPKSAAPTALAFDDVTDPNNTYSGEDLLLK